MMHGVGPLSCATLCRTPSHGSVHVQLAVVSSLGGLVMQMSMTGGKGLFAFKTAVSLFTQQHMHQCVAAFILYVHD